MITFKSLKEKLSIGRYVRHFDKKNFSQTIGLVLGTPVIIHIGENAPNIWVCFVIFLFFPVSIYILSYFILSKLFRFQFKIEDLIMLDPRENKINTTSFAMFFSVWMSLALIGTYMITVDYRFHFGLLLDILLKIALPLLLFPFLIGILYIFFKTAFKYFIKLRNKFKLG